MASPLLNYDPDIAPEDRWTLSKDESRLIKREQPTILDLRAEVRHFQNLKDQDFPIDFIINRRTDRQTLRAELLSPDKAYDVLHFSGHGHKGWLGLEGPHAQDSICLGSRTQVL